MACCSVNSNMSHLSPKRETSGLGTVVTMSIICWLSGSTANASPADDAEADGAYPSANILLRKSALKPPKMLKLLCNLSCCWLLERSGSVEVSIDQLIISKLLVANVANSCRIDDTSVVLYGTICFLFALPSCLSLLFPLALSFTVAFPLVLRVDLPVQLGLIKKFKLENCAKFGQTHSRKLPNIVQELCRTNVAQSLHIF